MANVVNLSWKTFPTNLEKVKAQLRSLYPSNFDGLLCTAECLFVVGKTDWSDTDAAAISSWWDGVTSTTFAATMAEIVTGKINASILFGQQMIVDAATGNVMAGVTQAGKTKRVSDYLSSLERYLRSGSLYAALQEIDDLLAAGIPEDINMFVTVDRMNAAKAKIAAFLGQ